MLADQVNVTLNYSVQLIIDIKIGAQGPRGPQGDAGVCPDCNFGYAYQFQQQNKGPPNQKG